MNPLLYVLIFLTTVLAVEGVYHLVRARRDSDAARIRRRLQGLAGRLQVVDAAAGGGEDSILRGSAAGEFSLSETLLGILPNRESLDLLLYRAGMPMRAPRFLFVSALMTGVGWLTAAMIMNDLALGAVGTLAGLIPWFAMRTAARRRMRVFEEQFPDALELLTRALRAGHALGTGFHLVGEEMADPVGTEFTQMSEEIKFGLDIRAALMNLAHRVGCPDVPYFVTAVLIQRETGGNLAELLDNLGDLIRERAKFYGKVRALTAQSRLSAVILALWLPVIILGMMVLRPEYIGVLFASTMGYVILAVAGALDVIGYVIARKLADVEA